MSIIIYIRCINVVLRNFLKKPPNCFLVAFYFYKNLGGKAMKTLEQQEKRRTYIREYMRMYRKNNSMWKKENPEKYLRRMIDFYNKKLEALAK